VEVFVSIGVPLLDPEALEELNRPANPAELFRCAPISRELMEDTDEENRGSGDRWFYRQIPILS